MDASSSPAPDPHSSPLSLQPFSNTSIPRLQALYSDFSRQKHSNPTSYNANVDWWHDALEAVVAAGLQYPLHQSNTSTTSCLGKSAAHLEDSDSERQRELRNSDRLVLHAGKELMDRLKIAKVGKPIALGAVISELCNSRMAIPLSDFLSSKKSVYDAGWLPVRIVSYVVGKPLWWALEQAGIVGEEGLLGQGGRRHGHKDTSWWGDFVFLRLLESTADAIVDIQEAKQVTPSDALYTFDTFRSTFGTIRITGSDEPLREIDTRILLKYLERDRSVVVVNNESIKFVDKQTPMEDRIISPVDHGILELKSAINNLHMQVDAIQNKMEDYTNKATVALQQKRKPTALSYLRSRKLLEDVLNKRLGSLTTLESTFLTVEAAAGDIEIMKSYETSTTTLRAILAHPSLDRSNVDKTMEALAEANADAKELDDAIQLNGGLAMRVEDNVDDAELEEEWKTMVQELQATQPKPVSHTTAEKLEKVGSIPNYVSSTLVSDKAAVPSLI